MILHPSWVFCNQPEHYRGTRRGSCHHNLQFLLTQAGRKGSAALAPAQSAPLLGAAPPPQLAPGPTAAAAAASMAAAAVQQPAAVAQPVPVAAPPQRAALAGPPPLVVPPQAAPVPMPAPALTMHVPVAAPPQAAAVAKVAPPKCPWAGRQGVKRLQAELKHMLKLISTGQPQQAHTQS